MFDKDRIDFNFVRYANVWEDGDILCAALRCSKKNQRILSIASSGDNVLALLTLDPKEIVAVDVSIPQLACLELRLAAFKELDFPTLCEFLGIISSHYRLEIYNQHLKKHLSDRVIPFWENNTAAIECGIIQAGKFERYLKRFGKSILPLIHSTKTINQLFKPLSKEQRKQFFEKEWNSWKWRLLFKVFFSRFVMGRLGRDPAFFENVEGKTAERILERSKEALTREDTHANPYLRFILKGSFKHPHLPLYLREEVFDVIKARVDRVKLVHGSIEESLEGTFDAFNLSDIFEYMDEEQFAATYRTLLTHANQSARFAYWNMLVDRSCPKSCLSQVTPLIKLAQKLHAKDKAWFYKRFVVEEVSCRLSSPL